MKQSAAVCAALPIYQSEGEDLKGSQALAMNGNGIQVKRRLSHWAPALQVALRFKFAHMLLPLSPVLCQQLPLTIKSLYNALLRSPHLQCACKTPNHATKIFILALQIMSLRRWWKRQPCWLRKIDCGFQRSAILVVVLVKDCAECCF